MSKMLQAELLTYDDVIIIPNGMSLKSRKDADLKQNVHGLQCNIPIVSANMDTVTGHQMAAKMSLVGGVGLIHRFLTIDEAVEEYRKAILLDATTDARIGSSLGLEDGLDRAKKLSEAGCSLFCIDVAHGYSEEVGKLLEALRKALPRTAVLIAGNVVTKQGASYLFQHGADIVKVGIGSGAACTTRVQTGCGVPQFSAIIECAAMGPIIADGGCKTPGDVVKALAAGAKLVMLGKMLAGCDEAAGEWNMSGIRKQYNGMASYKDYKEGVQGFVPPAGPIDKVIENICGGIRSGMSYVGASNLEELRDNAMFARVTQNGYKEGLPSV